MCCCLSAVGAFETVSADKVQPGNLIVLLNDPSDAQAGFVVSAVETAEFVEAAGVYNPAVEMPYIIAEGAVVPL